MIGSLKKPLQILEQYWSILIFFLNSKIIMGNRQSHQSADADTLRRAQTAANTKKNARDLVQPSQKQDTIPVLPSSPSEILPLKSGGVAGWSLSLVPGGILPLHFSHLKRVTFP